tara:strand:- start:1379 stop:1558 length:180 start_codon:yes stop_codon:yes gene_type:complete
MKPMDYESQYVKQDIPYKEYVNAIKEIINNFRKYTSWQWNEKLNYKKQSDKLYRILKGT